MYFKTYLYGQIESVMLKFKDDMVIWFFYSFRMPISVSKALRPCSMWLSLPSTINIWHRSFTFNSNKSPTWCNNFSVYYPDVCLQLNMFRAFYRPSLGAKWLQRQPLVLTSYRGDSRAVFVVGPAGQTTKTGRLSPRYEGKTRGYHCSHWAPDDGRENARNMLSCKQMPG